MASKEVDLKALCEALNNDGRCSFVLEQVKVLKAVRKINLAFDSKISGSLRVEHAGKVTEYEISAGGFKILDGQSQEL